MAALRIFNLCRSLSDRAHFILACFREKGDEVQYEKLHEIFAEVYVIDRDERPLQHTTLPKQVREHASSSMRALISDLCRQKQIDLLQIEFAHLAQFRDAAPDVPAILVEHDLTFGLYQQLAERAEHQRWLAFERHWFSNYDAVWTMSEEDRCAAIGEGSPAARTFVVPNGVDVARFVPGSEPAMGSEILYVGSFRHLPNVLGFQKLRYEIMPGIWRRHPNARLRVVAGPDHQRYCRDFQLDSRIVVHGFVEDLRPLYAQASVVVIPLQVSAGTNIKVLEAMACQKAIVTTPVGCVGLGLRDGQEALIRDNPKEFADAVGELLDDRSVRLQLAARARRTVESRFSWTAIADRAYESYRQLAGVPQP